MIAPGTVLQNRYLVERRVGEGGMGAVYVATDQRFGSTVALKETFFDDPNLRKAFEREARLLNRLRHPALPRVSDHFNEGEGQFLVMEYIHGEDLSAMLKERGSPFAVARVLAWADQLLDALDYLHTQEPPVIHRDIKPQNLKLAARDQIVLLDFGLAKGSVVQTRVTATGSLFGYSFNYAPIEQMRGSGTDPRSDLYSLGATLYHLLTGSPPPDALTRATAVLDGEQDPLRPASDANPRVPAEVSEVLARAMRQTAAKRFATAEEMRAALRDARKFVNEDADEAATAAATLSAVPATEQETRLLDSRPAATSPHAARPQETGVGTNETDVGANDAATLVNTELAASAKTEAASPAAHTGAHTPSARRDGESGEESRSSADSKSVVTRVRVRDSARGESKGSRGESRGSRRALVAAVLVVAAALAAVGVYTFAFRDDAPRKSAERPAPQTQTTPDAAQPAAQQPATAEASPTPAPAQAEQQRQAPAATSTDTGQQKDARPAEDAARAPQPPQQGQHPEPPATDETDAEAEAAFRNRDWVNNPPTQEEIDRYAARYPRRARVLRRIMQQRRRRGLPVPPPRHAQPPPVPAQHPTNRNS